MNRQKAQSRLKVELNRIDERASQEEEEDLKGINESLEDQIEDLEIQIGVMSRELRAKTSSIVERRPGPPYSKFGLKSAHVCPMFLDFFLKNRLTAFFIPV